MQDLILLHGALGAKSQFDDLVPLLNKDYTVHTLNFSGHGGEKPTDTFSIEHFSEDLVEYIRKNRLQQPNVFGYSMGGYVALYSAGQFPDLYGDIITLGTKFDWTPESAAKEVKMLNPEKIQEKIPAFAVYLDSLHTPFDWKDVMRKTTELMLHLGERPLLTPELLGKIKVNVALHVGEKDTMVTQEETLAVKDLIKNSGFDLVQDLVHPIQQINPYLLVDLIKSKLLSVQR